MQKSRLFSTLTFLCSSTLIFVIFSCNTVKDPGKSRESESLSLGSGVVYNPKRNIGLSASVSLSELVTSDSVNIRSGESGSSSYSINGDTNDSEMGKVNRNSKSLDLVSMYFPWDQSSFFVGMHSNLAFTRLAYNELTSEQNSSIPATTNVEWEDKIIKLGPTLGFNLRYESGTDLTFGTSYGRNVAVYRSFLDSGESDGVNTAVRERTLSSFDSYNNRYQASTYLMFTQRFKP